MSTQNITLKFKDVIVKQIICDAVKMGKDVVPLLKYGPDKKVLFIQGPWIKIKQYGVPAGEKLANGSKNEFYNGEDSRLSFRFPIHTDCCVKTDVDNDLDNSDEIKDFIKFLQVLDSHIKSDSTFMTLSGVDSDDKEKYTPIYRKPVKSKKVSDKEPKEKYYSMKTKLDTDGKRKPEMDGKARVDDDENDSHKKIKTEIYIVDNETKETKLVNKNKYITIDEFENNVKFNSEVMPIIQLVKIWTQSNGNWGVTLKLKKARVKNPVYSEMGNVEFLDSDTDVFVKPEHDSESDEEVTKVVSKPTKNTEESNKKPEVKTVSKLCVDEDDSESDDEPVPVQTKKVTKVVDIESDSDDDEDVKPKKQSSSKKTVVKSKKANA